jgi:hypothetical protein
MHPAVAFGAVILGAALFGVAGARVAVPIAALLLSLVEIYSRTYDVVPQLGPPARDDPTHTPEPAAHHSLGERLRRMRVRSGEVTPLRRGRVLTSRRSPRTGEAGMPPMKHAEVQIPWAERCRR